MTKLTSWCLVAALFSTILIPVVGLVILLVAAVSMSGRTGRIGAVAGGVSNSVFMFLIAAAPLVLGILILTFRKVFRRRGSK